MKTPLELGEILKAARRAENLELSDLSVRTGLPEKYLLALERGAHEDLPGRAYARIYYLNYARALKLDYEGLMQSWPQPVPKIEPAPAGEPQKRGRIFVWLGIPIVLIAVWGIFRGGAPVSERSDENADPASPETAMTAEGAAAPREDPVADSSAPAGVADSATTRPPFDAPAFVDVPPVRHHLKLVARAASWVVIEADGDTVEAQVLERGGELTAEASTDFVLTILLPREIVATLDDELLVMPEGGTRSLLRHRFALKNPEDDP